MDRERSNTTAWQRAEGQDQTVRHPHRCMTQCREGKDKIMSTTAPLPGTNQRGARSDGGHHGTSAWHQKEKCGRIRQWILSTATPLSGTVQKDRIRQQAHTHHCLEPRRVGKDQIVRITTGTPLSGTALDQTVSPHCPGTRQRNSAGSDDEQ
jgi:hypothetical protein